MREGGSSGMVGGFREIDFSRIESCLGVAVSGGLSGVDDMNIVIIVDEPMGALDSGVGVVGADRGSDMSPIIRHKIVGAKNGEVACVAVVAI